MATFWQRTFVFLSLMLAPALVVSGLFVSAEAAEKIYQWRDKDGKLHFSDKPPESNDVQLEAEKEIKQEPTKEDLQDAQQSAARRIAIQQKRLSILHEENHKTKMENEQREKQEKELKGKCSELQDQILLLKSRGVVFHKNEKGERQYITDEERNQVIADYEKKYKEHC
ncbi:MAG: DUF4124 domain-containing protein [Leptospiraceae bacterium]|nr:DUF4124 domain-containing protein [Leptospiraceae bacterium]